MLVNHGSAEINTTSSLRKRKRESAMNEYEEDLLDEFEYPLEDEDYEDDAYEM